MVFFSGSEEGGHCALLLVGWVGGRLYPLCIKLKIQMEAELNRLDRLDALEE